MEKLLLTTFLFLFFAIEINNAPNHAADSIGQNQNLLWIDGLFKQYMPDETVTYLPAIGDGTGGRSNPKDRKKKD